MKSELISVIVPIYNGEKWLERCIDSIVNQSYKNIEIILINDGSKDLSLEICNNYALKDSRIKIIDKKNTGVSNSRNEGILIAKGKYIQFVDCDDYLEENACYLLLKNIQENNSQLSVCGMNIKCNNKIIRNPYLPKKILNVKDNEEDLIFLLKILNSPCNKLYIKKCIKSLFAEDIELGEDLLFNLNYLKDIEKTVTFEACLYNVYLDNNNSLNRKFDKNKLINLIRLFEKEQLIYDEMYSKRDRGFWNQRIINSIASNLVKAIANLEKKEALELLKIISNDKFIITLSKSNQIKSLKCKLFIKAIVNNYQVFNYYILKIFSKLII